MMTSTGSLLAFALALCLLRLSRVAGGGGREEEEAEEEEDWGGVRRERQETAAALLGRSRLPFLSRSWRHLLKQPVLKVGWEAR